MLNISYAACFGLCVVNSVQFALKMYLTARNRQNIHKNRYFDIQGHPQSLSLVAIESQCTTSY